MKKAEYKRMEDYMLSQMKDSAHDKMHVYRVLNGALDIASYEENVDYDILIAACLLHDIGRDAQAKDPSLCHAAVGGEMAFSFLQSMGWDAGRASHVKACIQSHRFRHGNPPKSIEGRVLFDADKLDVTGAIGIARTLLYGGQENEPLYALDSKGEILVEGGGGDISSFFQEFNFKLRKLYDSFYTRRGSEIALERKATAISFYDNFFSELRKNHYNSEKRLATFLENE